MIVKDHEELSVRKQAHWLGLHRSTLYYQPKAKSDEAVLMNEIHAIWLKRPFYGYRRIYHALRRSGHGINIKKVSRLMRVMNLQALYPKKRLSLPNKDDSIYPYLLRNLEIKGPNHVWQCDITYIKLAHGFVYLVCLIDVHSRYIVAWELSNCLSVDFCTTMLDKALIQEKPEIINTDQGSQFTSQVWISMLQQHGIQISMDGVGRCLDNIYIERFWRTLKYEDINLMAYDNVTEAYHGIKEFIEFYNNERIHSALDYKTPIEIYQKKLPAILAANDSVKCVLNPLLF